ncbi:hypothetical protein SNEBB_005713 [Seison nebaliae]|nr:hypothetical protein SNEBB_005713 [Seison nebaliae]
MDLTDHYNEGELELTLLKLKEVPVEEIRKIPKAKHLNLSCNLLTSIPDSFALKLTYLSSINLGSNRLSCLPDNMGLIKNLKHLIIANNLIKDFPLSMHEMRLETLDARSNPLLPKWKECLGYFGTNIECKNAAKRLKTQLTADFMRQQWEENEIVESTSKETPKKKKSAKIKNKDQSIPQHATGDKETMKTNAGKQKLKKKSGKKIFPENSSPKMKKEKKCCLNIFCSFFNLIKEIFIFILSVTIPTLMVLTFVVWLNLFLCSSEGKVNKKVAKFIADDYNYLQNNYTWPDGGYMKYVSMARQKSDMFVMDYQEKFCLVTQNLRNLNKEQIMKRLNFISEQISAIPFQQYANDGYVIGKKYVDIGIERSAKFFKELTDPEK